MKKIITLFIIMLGLCVYGNVQARGPRHGSHPVPHCAPRFDFGFHRSQPVWPVYRPRFHTHVCIPMYRSVWCPPVYKTVIIKYDECGRPVYETICIRAGYYNSIIYGYRCDCGHCW
jgi:hypothetical protein